MLATHPCRCHPDSAVMWWKVLRAGTLEQPCYSGVLAAGPVQVPPQRWYQRGQQKATNWWERVTQLHPQMLQMLKSLLFLFLNSFDPLFFSSSLLPTYFLSSYNLLSSISSPQIHSFHKYLSSTSYTRHPIFAIPQTVLHPHFSLKLLWTMSSFGC